MSEWRDYGFTIGMPHLAPNRLSEVELLKWLAAFQWESTSAALGQPPNRIASAQGERLYASVINVELCFPPARSIDTFDEGTELSIKNQVRSYAQRFVEGLFVFDAEPIPAELLATVKGKADLERLDRPWAHLTTAFIARGGSNGKLKVFEPVGMDVAAMPVEEDRLVGIVEHQAVQTTGRVPSFPGAEAALPLSARDEREIRYEILPESDINGAGLLYFARYVAITNYAERVFFTERLERPLSRQLNECLAIERRRIFFFVNADAGDSVRAFVEAAFVPPTAAPASGSRRSLGKLVVRVDMHRASDGALMACSLAEKSISVSGNERNVVGEVDRLRARLARGHAR